MYIFFYVIRALSKKLIIIRKLCFVLLVLSLLLYSFLFFCVIRPIPRSDSVKVQVLVTIKLIRILIQTNTPLPSMAVAAAVTVAELAAEAAAEAVAETVAGKKRLLFEKM